uniref:Ubiquitin-like domain-containing protein n=1 Tax=Rhabditophanes sp. KR3021 TaxID=114890 RepID=A0AC35TSW5_9BILA
MLDMEFIETVDFSLFITPVSQHTLAQIAHGQVGILRREAPYEGAVAVYTKNYLISYTPSTADEEGVLMRNLSIIGDSAIVFNFPNEITSGANVFKHIANVTNICVASMVAYCLETDTINTQVPEVAIRVFASGREVNHDETPETATVIDQMIQNENSFNQSLRRRVQQNESHEGNIMMTINRIQPVQTVASHEVSVDLPVYEMSSVLEERNTLPVVNLMDDGGPDSIRQIFEDVQPARDAINPPLVEPIPNNETAAEKVAETKETIKEEELDSFVKIKFLDDTERRLAFNMDMTIRQFKIKYFNEEVVAGKTIRLIFQGQLLRDNTKTLMSCGVKDNAVIHCHISDKPIVESNESLLREVDGPENVVLPESRNIGRSRNTLTVRRQINVQIRFGHIQTYSHVLNYLGLVLVQKLIEFLYLVQNIARRYETVPEDRFFQFYTGILFNLEIQIRYVEQCGTCGGGCGGGGGGGCCRRRSKMMSAPKVKCNPANCPFGYSCKEFGCSKNKILSAITNEEGILISDEEFLNKTSELKLLVNSEDQHANRIYMRPMNGKLDMATYEKLSNPNFLFRQCCEERNLPDACISKCNFKSYSKESLQNMFFNNDACPIEAVADIQYCAAQGRNHVQCCKRAGVDRTLAGSKCLLFCDQRPGRVEKLDFTFIPCYDKFESMKQCFYDEIKHHTQSLLQRKLYKNSKSFTENIF